MSTILISGTTRGIGLGLLSSLLLRPNTTVVSGVRDPSAAAARKQESLPKAAGSKLIIVKLDSTSPADAGAAVASIQRDHGISHLDIVLANAGVSSENFQTVAESTREQMLYHFEVNTLAPLSLFQATKPLLEKSTREPRFVLTSTKVASNSLAPEMDLPIGWYGASKIAANYMFRKASGEEKLISFFLVHPGFVNTDISLPARKHLGMDGISVEESVTGYLALLDKPAAETAGKFLEWNGNELPW